MEDLIDISKLNRLDPEKGRVLISEPFMEDEYFRRSVVYLCEHNEEGSFGFVLNNDLELDLSEVVEDINIEGFKLGFGGPVNSNNLYYLHTLGKEIEESYEVVPGLYSGGKFDQITALINENTVRQSDIRFFLGYSGWDAGQLKGEMEKNAWIVANAEISEVMSTSDKSLWKKLLKRMGGKFKMISNFPEDPTLN